MGDDQSKPLLDAQTSIQSALDLDGLTDAHLQLFRRTVKVLAYARSRVINASSDLSSEGAISQALKAANTIASQATEFVKSRDENHIPPVRQALEQIIVALPNIRGIASEPIDLDSFRSATQTYENSLNTAIRDLRNQSATISKEAAASRDEVNKAAQTTRERIEQAAAGVQQRLEALTSQIADERQKLLNLATDYQSQFSSAQDQRSKDFSSAQNDQQERARKVADEYTKKLLALDASLSQEAKDRTAAFQKDIDQLRTTHQEEALRILGEIAKNKTQVEKLVGVIGNLGVTSGYLKAANLWRTLTWIWQGTTVASLLGLLGVAIWTLTKAMGEPASLNFSVIAAKVFVALTFGFLAAYAAVQAERAATSERRNRRLALELEAIGPFLAPLEKEKQDEFRLKIGDRSFGQLFAEDSKSIGNSATFAGHLLTQDEVKNFILNLAEIAKKWK
jgi:hypothetical protein